MPCSPRSRVMLCRLPVVFSKKTEICLIYIALPPFYSFRWSMTRLALPSLRGMDRGATSLIFA